MKLLRKKGVLRIFSMVAMLIILNSIAYPLYALTTGPHQPEYISYEDSASNDMVNLLTGDFSLTMPILSVPIAAEGSFPVPLSYHAGISPETDASWVGLGWNINIGSLTRSINEFPDDAKGAETQTIQVEDAGHRGWSANFLGTHMGWDSQVGHYGVINTGGFGSGPEIGYDSKGVKSFGAVGITLGRGGKVDFDAVTFAVTVVEIVLTVLTYGTSNAATPAIETAMEVDAAMSAVGLALDAVMPDYKPIASTAGYWNYSTDYHRNLFHTNYWIWLDQTRTEEMYGTLYLDKVPTTPYLRGADEQGHPVVQGSIDGSQLQAPNQFVRTTSNGTINNVGSASDINIDLSNADASTYEDNVSPANLAYDDFSVKAPGISGNIKPYRLEIGSVSVPREMTSYGHIRLNPLSYMDYGTNKVPFVYEGTHENSYFNHVGGIDQVSTPTFNFGINTLKIAGSTPNYITNYDILKYDLQDLIFNNQRMGSVVGQRQKIPQGHFVDWLTNAEIKNTTNGFVSSTYLDYFQGTNRSDFRTNFPFGNRNSYYTMSTTLSNGKIIFQNGEESNFHVNDNVDINVSGYDLSDTQMRGRAVRHATYSNVNVISVNADHSITVSVAPDFTGLNASIEVIIKTRPKADHSIGGFVITSPEGMNYHFSIPVYDYDFKTETVNVANTTQTSTITRGAPIANTWLLTAITGPDYVDRGGTNNAPNGAIDNNDWGYWIKFNYGRHNFDYSWRLPYATDNSTYKRTSDDLYNSYAGGKKENYYLNSIETRSHVALFIKDSRSDGKDASYSRKSTLRLGEIALLTRDAYTQLIDQSDAYKLKNASGVIDFLYMYNGSSDANGNITGNKLTFIQSKALRRVVFNTSYSLCPGTPNSDASGGGKLTLNSLSVLGANSSKVFPDYKFEYLNNPAYHADKWDGWGYYSSTGTSAGTAHKASTVDSDAAAWSLTKVTNPEGSQIVVNYEADTYASISGTALSSNRKGGGIRVSSLQMVDPNGQSYKTRYLYNKSDDGKSYGVISQEPDYIRTSDTDYTFYKLLGYPITPVIYGQVTVLSGKLATDADFHTRQVYAFETPNISQYSISTVKVKDKELIDNLITGGGKGGASFSDCSSLIKHEIQNRTNQIGKINSITTWDNVGLGNIYSQQNFYYTNALLNDGVNNYQGTYSEGTLMFEVIKKYSGASSVFYHKGQRTTMLKYPCALQKVVTNTNGIVTSTEYKNWDLITGQVLETQQKSPLGFTVKTVLKPAYKISDYSIFGSKAIDPNNKNMLTQMAAQYSFRLDGWGNILGIIGASTSVWKSNWNYRILDANGNYKDDPDLANGAAVTRKTASYSWVGDNASLNGDGTFIYNTSDDFKFNSLGSNPKWKKTSSMERFDHYTNLLETRDMNGHLSAAKMGYNDQLILALATNAGYTEIAFSSAEDNASATYLGGEIKKGNGTVVTTASHSGSSSISLGTGYSFIYSPNTLATNKRYRASVWTNDLNGRLYYILNSGTEQLSVAPTLQKKIGNWYLLDFEIPIGATFSSLDVGVKNINGAASAILFDDFRFQPVDAAMVCYVYSPFTKMVEYVLDNDNVHSRYQYDDRGILIRTYQESFKYGAEKLISENKSDYRRFHYDQ